MQVLEKTQEQLAMQPQTLLTNLPLPEVLEQFAQQNSLLDKACFAVVGDLNLTGKYGQGALLFMQNGLWVYDSVARIEPEYFAYADLHDVKVRRMYGNALFQARDEKGKRLNLLRFTYAAAEAAEAGAQFVQSCVDDGFSPALIEAVQAGFDRRRAFCMRCGRQLRKPDAPCLNCENKTQTFGKFGKYILEQKWLLIFCLALSVVTTAMALVPPLVTGHMIDTVLHYGQLDMLLWMVLLLLGVHLVQFSVGAVRSYFLRRAGSRMVVELRKDIYAKTQFLPMRFFDKTSTGSVINRIHGDTSVLQQFILRITQEAVVQLFLMIGLMVIMFSLNWRLAAVSLLPVPLVVIGGRIFGKKIAPRYRRLWRRGSAIFALLADTVPGVRVIKAFTNEDRAIDKFARYNEEWYKEDMVAGKIASIFPNVMTFLVTCGSLVIWLIGGRWVIDGAGAEDALSIGMLVIFITYAGQFYNPVNFFANLNDGYQNALASVEKILDILEAEPERDFGKGDPMPDHLQGRIEFRNVNFSFDRSKKTLSNVNLVIEPGDIVGIVGTTGSGKSTLINLIMRYYDDYEGEILVDGRDLKEVDMAFYRSQIGYVQQEPLMFRASIFNNIAYGAGDVHPESVLYAAEVANAHGFIAQLPDAYDTLLGERGTGLSGGEKQRISIARAVLKNPSILIFDEATAAVDSETEHLIQDAIERLIRGRTTLMIAHRLSTLRKANKIIVVDKGEIIEFGSPAELLALQGKYYKLVQIQSMAEEAEKQRAEENF
ncbi:MAG: ABC transporter ATP-binding protein/permease [Oscillospiraceae bacterium]|nr:ABC transporter ATP-binding protein/permease [Oscillospiraceae bacterium]